MSETGKGPVEVTYLIIGAGPCGLLLGKKLQEHKKDFLILEKSRGVGGRVATRRIENVFVDHGAPYLKSCHELLDLFLEMKISGIKIDEKGIFTDEGMTALFKAMASFLPVRKEMKITKILRKNDLWQAETDGGEIFRTKYLILTAPLPQSIELLENGHIDFQYKYEIKSVEYSKAVMGIFLTDKEIILKDKLPEEVHSILTMRHRSSEKAVVLRLNEKYSDMNFSRPDHELLSEVEKIFISSCESTGRILFHELKKWRYVQPLTSLNAPFVEAAPQLYLGGDAFLFPDVRGALLSAEGLAKKLI